MGCTTQSTYGVIYMINHATVGRVLKNTGQIHGFKVTFLDQQTALMMKPKVIDYLTKQGFIVTIRTGANE